MRCPGLIPSVIVIILLDNANNTNRISLYNSRERGRPRSVIGTFSSTVSLPLDVPASNSQVSNSTRLVMTWMAPHIRRRLLAVRFICRIILAPTAIGFTIYYLASRFGLAYKPFLVLCGVVVGWPIEYSLEARYEGWHRTWKARAIGAVTASEAGWKSFGGMSVLGEIQETIKNGFVGEFIRWGRKPRLVSSNATLFF